jgi:hypothetical protein
MTTEEETLELLRSIDFSLKYLMTMMQVLTHKVTGTMVNPPHMEPRKGPLFPHK